MVVGHGAYLAYHYLRYRSVNTISLAVLVLFAAVAVVLTLLIVLARLLNRSEAKGMHVPEAK
jgi:hypothetical protein